MVDLDIPSTDPTFKATRTRRSEGKNLVVYRVRIRQTPVGSREIDVDDRVSWDIAVRCLCRTRTRYGGLVF